MLAYLLDENISPVVVEQLALNNPQITVQSVHRWRGGEFVGQADEGILRAAFRERLTLVTYDLKTIPPLLVELASENEVHAGVLFIDDASLRSNDFGGLVKALLAHWQQHE